MRIRRRPVSFDELRRRATETAEALYLELPPPLRTAARRLPLVIEGTPGAELVRSGVAPETLGLFVGSPFAEEPMGAPVPPEIILFVENLWAAAEADEDEYRAEVRRTLLHELGHYLGLDEQDLMRRDLD